MNGRLESQQFLGEDSGKFLVGVTAGIVGLSGGGSHVVQQLAHAGIGGFVPVDFDIVEEKNLNRLVGATAEDARLKRSKTDVAVRVIRGVNPMARLTPRRATWQESTAALRRCDVIFGCTDDHDGRMYLSGSETNLSISADGS